MKKYLQGLDWPLLIFLLLMLNVKLYIKCTAIILAFFLHRKAAFSFRQLAPEQRFYGIMIGLALADLLLSFRDLSIPALWAFGLGCAYWLLAMLAAWHIRLFVMQADQERLHRTLSFFFVLNVCMVYLVFLSVCIEAGTLNPYTYDGDHRKYFISTGDRMTGIGLDGSVATAITCAFGLLYFFYQRKHVLALLSLLALLLATSNYIDLLLLGVLLFAFCFRSDRQQKIAIGIYFCVIVLFSLQISPQNWQYATGLIGQAYGKHSYEPVLTIPHPHNNDFVEGQATAVKREQNGRLLSTLYTPAQQDSLVARYKGWDHSGRWIAWKELRNFFVAHPDKILQGVGMGNFSSRLAFKTAGLGIDGGYPESKQRISPYFRDNYLFLYLYYHSRDEGQHSVVNQPDSVYGQLLAEYGLLGVACFVVLYAIPFVRRARLSAYGLPVLLLLGGAFFTGYWFEQLSIVILFELLILSDVRSS